jgi:predicted TIM-barrel fold metal-dependent hydrolase
MIESMLEPGEVRKRLKQTIDAVRREAGARRAAAGEVGRDFEAFLEERAVPVFRQLASALKAEGLLFQLVTPAGSVRLASERAQDDYVEIVLDAARHPPVAVGRSSFVLGRNLTAMEEPLRDGVPVRDLTDEDVLAFALRAMRPFLER